MKKLFIIFAFILTASVSAQKMTTDSIYNADQIDKKPEFQGGIKEFYRHVAKNFRVPEKRNFNGKVVVKFVIEEDGSLSNFEIINDPGYGSGAEAIRVLQLSPLWIPGEKNQKTVRAFYIIPISFRNDG